MEPYFLTIDDINALAESGMDMRGVGEGTQANQAEMEALGTPTSSVADDTMSVLNPPAPATFNSQAEDIAATLTPEELASLRTPTGVPAPDLPPISSSNVQEVLGAGGVPAPASAPSGQTSLLQSLGVMAPQPASNDPYENLSKTQRRMLAFAGLSDAGAALQGRQGTSVKGMMSNFNAQADMQRKRQAAQAQQQMLQGLMGGGAAGGDPQARIQQLLNIAMANPSMAPAIALQVKQIQDQLQAASGVEGQVSQASTQLEDVQALLDMINDDPFMTTGIMSSLLSGIKVTPAGQAAALQKTLKSNLALQALKDLKATGATMGALNTTEFQALESELTNLDLGLGADMSKRSLLRIQNKYQSLIADAFRDAKEKAAAGDPMGQKGLDGLTKIFGGEPEWLSTAPPLQITAGKTWNPETQRFE